MTIRQTLRSESLHYAPSIFWCPSPPRGMSALPATAQRDLAARSSDHLGRLQRFLRPLAGPRRGFLRPIQLGHP
jgi:hypothetical protein